MVFFAFAVLYSHGLGAFVSPDGKYVARVTIGEAEAHDLRVVASGATKPVISEWDVTGLIWDPSKPHRLIYAESAVYGNGKIVEWDGGRQRVLWRGDYSIEGLAWDQAKHRLVFRTTPLEGASPRAKWRMIRFR